MFQPAEQTAELHALTEDWFNHLTRSSDDAMHLVLQIAQQPFGELHLLSLRLVNVLAAAPWGEQLLIAHPGFLEYLLDRSTERGDREGLEAKYSIVMTLVQSVTAGGSIAAELYQRLREYAREGLLYVRLEPQVEFDTGQ